LVSRLGMEEGRCTQGAVMIDAIRELVCAQSHRRMIEPRYLAKRVQPFEIVRPTPTPSGSAQHVGADGDPIFNHEER
jgi:hypothetical protein